MARKQSHAQDLLGLSRLTISAVKGVTELSEAVHMNVLQRAIGTPAVAPVVGTTAMVYRSVRAVTQLVGIGLDAVLTRLIPLLGEQQSWAGRDALLAAVNGVLGDQLEDAGNPLAIPMRLRRGGVALAVTPEALRQALPQANGRILVLAHGLCMNDVQWLRQGHDHGAMLERERGYTPVYLHYNSGRHISQNGREFADQLEALLAAWPVPVEQLVIVGHSMGGLLARSAVAAAARAGHAWPAKLGKLVFLGSPHHGAPLERGGNWVNLITDLNPYSAPFSRLAKLRSAGITDLRHGSVLDIDWENRDRFGPSTLPTPLPLPAGVACYTVAATIGAASGDLKDRLAGDGLVPLASALGQHADGARQLAFAPDHQLLRYQCNHMELLSDAEVGRQLCAWL